jgi:proton glutamate symport protein
VGLLTSGVLQGAEKRNIGLLGARSLPVFVALLIGGGLFAVLTAPLLFSTLVIDPGTASALRETASASETAETVSKLPSVTQRIIEVVPANPVKAAVDGAMLPLIVFTLGFAIAATRIAPARRERLAGLSQALADASLVLVKWVLLVAPVGVLALGATLGLRMGVAAAGAIGHYILTLCVVLAGYTALLYPLAAAVARVPLSTLASAALPAQAVAISTRSSMAALPANITSAREKLGLPAEATGFVLPLAVSVFRPNVPIAWVTGVLFLGALYGVDVTTGALLTLVLTATAMSFGVPGLPSASLLLLAPVLVSLGLPAEGVGILIAVDVIPDMLKTTANVTSHLVATTLVSGRPRKG